MSLHTHTHQNANLFCFLFAASVSQTVEGASGRDVRSDKKAGWTGRLLLGSHFPSSLLPVRFQTRGLHVGARGMGKPLLCPLPPLPSSSAQVSWLMLSSGVMVTTLVPPPVSVPSQPGRIPTPSASSLHVAEGSGLPQVPCLSNKVETLKTWAALSLFGLRVGVGSCAVGAKLREPPTLCPAPPAVQQTCGAAVQEGLLGTTRTTAGPALKAWPGVPHSPPCSSLAGFSSCGFSFPNCLGKYTNI